MIYDWLDMLAAKYPDKITTVIGGQSYENRQIKGVKYSTGGSGKRIIFVDGGMHAREWISPAVNTYMLNQVVTSQDPTVRELVDSFDWYFFPVINPDGYEYSRTTDRSWRKTRGPGNFFCVGTDPNRNYGFHWSLDGASDNPCAETYHGSGPFSEVETKSFSDFITPLGKDIDVYLSLHSFSQLVLFPMGYTDQHLPDYDNMLAVGQKVAQSLASRYGTVYTAGNIVDTLYVASGSNLDWVKGVFNTTYPYVFELRDTGDHGFLLPASQILPSGEETFDALITLAQSAKAM
ncbi:zinc carboxypeptidase-like [Hetaerina americana]|uniref:zinc carboxypeptidase-like n=1 Tax=Hetaerina americana TaxID=62018 RepID=UPI003A7F1ABE